MIPSPAVRGALTVRYLSRADVEAAGVTIDEVIGAVQTGFLEKGNGRVEMPPKPGVHPGKGDPSTRCAPCRSPRGSGATRSASAAVEADAFSGTLGRWRATLAHEASRRRS